MSAGDYDVLGTLVSRSISGAKQNHISWSRQGLIAYILDSQNDDGFSQKEGNLRLTFLECVDGKHWQLAPPTFFNIGALLTGSNPSSIPVHQNTKQVSTNYVLFSNTGWDLFTSDKHGNVTILVTGLKRVLSNKPNSELISAENINHNIVQMQYSRTSFNTCEIFYTEHNKGATVLESLGNKVITAKWLNLQKTVISNIPAIRIQQNSENQVLNGCASKMGAATEDAHGYYYRYNASQHKAYGPCHPLSSKQACLSVRANGEICLYHQEEHGVEYVRVQGNLHNESDSTDLITKSSIGYERNGKIIIAAYYEKSMYLKFYEVVIHWNYLSNAAKLLAENPNYRATPEEKNNPTMEVRKILQREMDNIVEGFTFTDIDIISPNFEQDSAMDVLVRVENKKLHLNDSFLTGIIRYQLYETPLNQFIHKSFKTIASKNSIDITQSLGTSYELKYSQTISINDAIISLESQHLDMYISMVLASGEVKLFRRATFLEEVNRFKADTRNIKTEAGLTPQPPQSQETSLPPTISTLLDAGYEFPRIEKQPVYACLSPNLCAYVSLPIDGSSLEVGCVVTHNVDPGYLKGEKKGLLLAKAAAIALRHTTACYLGYFTDDLVATIRTDLARMSKLASENYSYALMVSILQESHRAINLNIDITPEQSDKMTQNQPLQRLLTLQLSLSTFENWNKTRSGKIALALLNLRYIASSIMYTIHTIYSNIHRFAKKGFPATDTLLNAKLREECIISVVGVIRWCLDYIVLLSQEILELDSAFKSQNQERISKLMKDSIVIPLILGKIPRAFLVFSIANIRRLFSFVQKFIEKIDPSVTAKVTAENPLGGFDVIESWFLNGDSSVLQKKLGGPVKPGSPPNSKNGKAIVTSPIVEAYYRLGLTIKRLPVSLVAFEKFLSEADGPLRNMKLDAPTSLAIEQQIICQGYISRNFTDAIRKLSDVFTKSVLTYSDTKISDLYFYDVSWLGFNSPEDSEDDDYYDNDLSSEECHDNTAAAPQQISNEVAIDEFIKSDKSNLSRTVIIQKTDIKKSEKMYRNLVCKILQNGGIIDSVCKEWFGPETIMKPVGEYITKKNIYSDTTVGESSKTALTPTGDLRPNIRKCIRCGSISVVNDEVVFIPNSMTFVTNPVFQQYQRICICGGSWVNI